MFQPIRLVDTLDLCVCFAGESWFVAAEGDTNGPMALRFSENQEYFFNTGTTSYYDITFTENTSVDRLKARFMNTSSVRY